MTERDIFIDALQRDDPGRAGGVPGRGLRGDAALRADGWTACCAAHDRAGSFLEQPAVPPTGPAAYTPRRAGRRHPDRRPAR